MSLKPIVLESARVRLEPLSAHHREGLARAIRDGELWTIKETIVPPPDDLAAFFDAAEAAMQAGRALTFATVDPVRGQVVGSTRFMRFHPSYRRVEIGYTFLAQSVQRSGVNVAAKFLMLQHAFEALGLNRVELITDVRNGRSRGAIEALGARQEGTLRSHMVMPDGRIRDSVLYAIIRDEWPDVRARLRARLDPLPSSPTARTSSSE